ncbi:NAD(P)-binding protein, partial [Apiospora kogelbergensis]|uniref:NAD(P)-binding protein n=1 Tax=Apiospora kogelbergensis TaxID=1337665 RepID=UPI00312EB082
FHVIATARSKTALTEIAKHGLRAVELDVTSAASIAACRESVGRLTSKLDVLVNNAGRGLVVPATDINIDDARAVYETNVFGVMAMVEAFVDLLMPARGLIINVASVSAVVPYVFGSVYASSKAALASYSRTLRQELRPLGVRVMVAMAGAVRSNMGNETVVKGHLPDDSLYARVRHLYEARRGFSQRQTTGPMSTDVFASRLVDSALAMEMPSFWRPWFGRPDWFWCGGMAQLLYWGSLFGEWVLDIGAWRKFGLVELEHLVTIDGQSGVKATTEHMKVQ